MGIPIVQSIVETDDNNMVQLRINIDGIGYGFTLDGIPPEKHDWLYGVLSRQIEQIAIRSYRKGMREVQDGIKDALGIS